MILKVVFAQRVESYPGEFAPELYAGMTEYEYDENPRFLENKLEEAKNSAYFVAARMFEIELGAGTEDVIRAALLDPVSLNGSVSPCEGD